MKHMIQRRFNVLHVVCGSLFLVCALANLSLAGTLSQGIPAGFTDDYQSYCSGVVLVQFDLDALKNREGLSGPRTAQARMLAAARDVLPEVRLRRNLSGVVDGLVALNLPTGLGVQAAIRAFSQSSDVMSAEPSYKFRLAGTVPNDSNFGLQWQLNTDVSSGQLDVDINAPEAWDIITSTADSEDPENKASRIMVAVLDTGVDYNHVDLGGFIENEDEEDGLKVYDPNGNLYLISDFYYPEDANFDDPNADTYIEEGDPNYIGYDHGADFTSEEYEAGDWPYDLNDLSKDGKAFDPNGHGTMVAGIIGAIGNNEEGIAGVAWDVNILPVKVATNDEDTGEMVVSLDAALAGIEYAVEMGAKVVNMSWTTDEEAPFLYSAMSSNSDVMFVCAAGDDGNDIDENPVYPAYYAGQLTNVISVLATDQTGGLWEDLETGEASNYGSTTVTIGAPGADIPSLMPDDSYGTGSGTSYAAPHVSGAIALAMALNPDMTPDQLCHLLFHWYPNTPITDGEGLCQTNSRLDMYHFLHMVRPGKVVRESDTDTEYDSIQDAIDSIDSQVYMSLADSIIVQSDRWYFEEIRSNANGYLFNIKSGDIEGGDYDSRSPDNTYLSGYMSAYERRIQLGLSDQQFIEYIANYGTDIILPYKNLFQLDAGEPVAVDPNYNAGVTGLSLVDSTNAVYLSGSAALIDNCLIYYHNSQSAFYGIGTSSILRDCEIWGHTSSAINIMGDSDVEISGCTVYDNADYDYGGGVLLQSSQLSVSGSNFSDNTALYNAGGAIAVYDGQLTVRSSVFSGNMATDWEGGAIWLYDSTANIKACRFLNNESSLDGGAIYLEAESNLTLTDNLLTGNIAGFTGGALASADGSTSVVNNNLLIGNISSGYGGGALYYSDSSSTLSNCTFVKNDCEDSNEFGGAILCEGSADVALSNSIMANHEETALAEGSSASLSVDHCLFFKNQDGDFYNPTQGYLKMRDPNHVAILGASNSYADPLFVTGPMSEEWGDAGNYYLSQFDAGQMLDANDVAIDPDVNPADANSPAVDAGSALASELDMAGYSTRTDNILDSGLVDLGYHYSDDREAESIALESEVRPNSQAGTLTITTPTGTDTVKAYSQIILEASTDNEDFVFESWSVTINGESTVITDNPAAIVVTGTVTIVAQYSSSTVELRVNVIGGGGQFISPSSLRTQVARGAVVNLEVLPDGTQSYVEWNHFADEPHSMECTNTVTMSPPFTKTRTRPDGSTQEIMEITARLYEPNVYTVEAIQDIQNAIDQADDLDIIQLENNTYGMDYNIQVSKNIRIVGESTDKTVIVPKSAVYPDYAGDSIAISGRAFNFFGVDANAVLENLTIRGFSHNGGNGADGEQSEDSWTYFHGSPGGIGQGAAIFCQNASPTIKNVYIENCSVSGGTGGQGADGTDTFPDGGYGGWPGAARGAAISLIDSNSVIMNCNFYNCSVQGGSNGLGGSGGGGADGENGGLYDQDHLKDSFDSDDYDYFAASTGVGGAVFANYGSVPQFIDCNFIDCNAEGSLLTEIGNNDYRIDTFGGAVYLSGPLYRFISDHQPVRTGSVSLNRGPAEALFENCYFENNRAYQEVMAVTQEEGLIEDNTWTGYGGAMAFIKGQDPNLVDCTFTLNTSAVGGAIWARRTEGVLNNCEITQNLAYTGGGACFEQGAPQIKSVLFEDNNARVDLFTDVNSIEAGRLVATTGKGGALRLYASDALIQDTEFRGNAANESGGALYIASNGSPQLRNSLFVENWAGADGGAISINSLADVTIRNCTITDNTVNGTTGEGSGLGGGLYLGQYSYLELIDSIVWDNHGVAGAQMALGEVDEYTSYPSAVVVDHTLIGPSYDPDALTHVDEMVAAYEVTLAEQEAASGTTVISSDVVVGSSEISAQFSAGADTVPVIVTLKLSSTTEVDWSSDESVAERQVAVATLQERLSDSIGSSEFEITNKLTSIPVVIGSVTSNGLTMLANNKLVEHVEPVREVHVAMSQALDLGNATEIRDSYPGSGVSVAIVDSGVDYTHPMLGDGEFPNNKVIGGYDFGDGTADTEDDDPMPGLEPHGTACAGIAAGSVGSVGDYVGGVAYDAKIYALKIAEDDVEDTFETSSALLAWEWCLTHYKDDPDNPIKVISNSWNETETQYTSAEEADSDYPSFATLAEELTNAGILVVAAAGNQGDANSIRWPAAMTDVMSVGALDDTTAEVMDYSNTGNLLDIYAPADPVYTTDIVGDGGYTTGNYYSAFNGTSSACPFLAGCVASLQCSAYERLERYLTPAEVKAVLIETGDETIDSKAIDIVRPRVNLARAISGETAWPIAVDEGCQINNWVASESSWYVDWQSDWTDNYEVLTDDPQFVGDYYLTQTGDDASPAIDSGSADVNDPNVALSGTTTSINGDADLDQVDLGYHHEEGVQVYTIYASVVPDADGVVYGTLDPDGTIEIVAGEETSVSFTATPMEGYKVKAWTGTDNDNSTAKTNKVTLGKDTEIEVTVEFEVAELFTLTAEVSGDGGRISEVLNSQGVAIDSVGSGLYNVYDGSELTVVVELESGYKISSWSGTDDDSSTDTENLVTIDGQDVQVTVEVTEYQAQTLYVGGSSNYQSIQSAVNAADDGSVIIVRPGTYSTGEVSDSEAYNLAIMVIDKSLEIRSSDPTDPCTVAETIIDGGDNYRGVVFGPSADSSTILSGFTIQNCGGTADDGDDGSIDTDSGTVHPDGYDGVPNGGNAIVILPGASPIIKNCVIRDNTAQGGDGGSGSDATDTYNAGRGGWGGWARGGAVYIGTGASPIFMSCTLQDNVAQAGDGGDGGAGGDTMQGNYGGNYCPDNGLNIGLQNTETEDDPNLWKVWEWDNAYTWYQLWENEEDVTESDTFYYIGAPRWYSAYGGAVFCAEDSIVTFMDCVISGNRTYGGASGVGGTIGTATGSYGPLYNYEMDSFGGAVYCAEGAWVEFDGCSFEDNVASGDDVTRDVDVSQWDNTTGHGGGVCAEDSAWISFTSCTFLDNSADSGGALETEDVIGEVVNCHIDRNMGVQGAGVSIIQGHLDVMDSNFVRNDAVYDANDTDDDSVLGYGAGIYMSQASAVVMDCNFTGNLATGTGGAVFVEEGSYPLLVNCLIHYNGAEKNGGAVAIVDDSEAILQNCTMVYNRAYGYSGGSGNSGLGGALYIDHLCSVAVYDSILWQNGADYGSEVALLGDDADSCATLDLWHSDMYVDVNDLYSQGDDVLTYHGGMLFTDPDFTEGPLGNYYLSSNSSLVDAGSEFAGSLGMVFGTTRTDERLDAGLVDIGYHYPVTQPCRFCDLTSTSFDGYVDFTDFALMAQTWGRTDLDMGDGTDRVDNGDVSLDGAVDLFDLSLFSNCWLAFDQQAPTPNPVQWATEPYRSGSSAAMRAESATDFWGGDVEYYFDCVSGGGHDSDWQSSESYTDTGLSSSQNYNYRFRARDERGNMTQWSSTATIDDASCYAPTGSAGLDVNEVTEISLSVIGGYLDQIHDDGVEYYFVIYEYSDMTEVNDSNWFEVDAETQPSYTFEELKPDTTYVVKYKARSLCGSQPESDWLGEALVQKTSVSTDTTPPDPSPMTWSEEIDSNDWDGRPHVVRTSDGYQLEMTATEATDDSDGTVYYQFLICNRDNDPEYTTDWQTDTFFRWDEVGAYKGSFTGLYCYVRARDEYWNITEWSIIDPDTYSGLVMDYGEYPDDLAEEE